MATRRTRLVKLRDDRGWRQKDVAERLGITESYYGMIEAGVRNPSLKIGLGIARLFGVPVAELFFASEANGKLDEHIDEQATASG